jgi:hypothetical protein
MSQMKISAHENQTGESNPLLNKVSIDTQITHVEAEQRAKHADESTGGNT